MKTSCLLQSRSITVLRKHIANRSGTLASTLTPSRIPAPTCGGEGYPRLPDEQQAAIELYRVAGKAVIWAAQDAGLAASSIPTLLVEGDNRLALATPWPRPSRRRESTSRFSWRRWSEDATPP